MGCCTSATMNVHGYSRFKPTSTTRLQDFGRTLTAAPVSIKYLHLCPLSATYNNLE